MSDRQIIAILPHLFATGDPRLNQYLAAIYSRGFSLRAIGEVARVSYETVRLRIIDAETEQNNGFLADLSALPDVTFLPKRKPAKVPYFLSDTTKALIKDANTQAQQYKKGRDDTGVKVFNTMVIDLVAQGIPFSAIAAACEQDPHHLRRRLARWGAYPHGRRRRHTGILQEKYIPPVVVEESAPMQVEAAIPCKWPDCPSHSGGQCIHI